MSSKPLSRFAGETAVALSRYTEGAPAQKAGSLSRARLKVIEALGWASVTDGRGPRGSRIWRITVAGLAYIAATRQPIRKAALKRERQVRGNIIMLNAPEKLPEPNHEVVINLASAARERKKAAIAASRYIRKACLLAAQRYDKAANEAHAKQIEEHWSKMADTETAALARIRGDDLELEETDVPEWLRDEHGALVRDKDGMPQLRSVTAIARRRKGGLKHVADKRDANDKPLMSPKQYAAGLTYGEACAAQAQAVLNVPEGSGVPSQGATKPSPGPADWKLEAMATKKLADYRLRIALGEIEGLAMINLLTAICYEGLTPRQYAGGDERQGIRAEERLLIGLNILGVRGDFALPKVQA